jgi:hypothetical protein
MAANHMTKHKPLSPKSGDMSIDNSKPGDLSMSFLSRLHNAVILGYVKNVPIFASRSRLWRVYKYEETWRPDSTRRCDVFALQPG